MNVFVVNIYRLCERNNESFSIGVFSRKVDAEKAGRYWCYSSGYKHGYEISEFKVDHFNPDEDFQLDEIVCPHGNKNWVDVHEFKLGI